MRKLITIGIALTLIASGAHGAKRATAAAEAGAALGINAALEAEGSNVRLAYAEFVTANGSDFAGGKLIFFKDTGNKQLGSHWVPGDPRRGGFIDIAYFVDTVDGVANKLSTDPIDADTTTAAIDRGMDEWQGIGCSSLPITNLGAINEDLGFVQFLSGTGGGLPFPLFDITHGGWLPGEFFEAVRPGGASGILGITFTFDFIDPSTGELTDIDRNGKADTAFREIYMNDSFAWEIGNQKGGSAYDIEAVMFHEQGHSLSQAHFGEISLNRRGKVIVSPAGGRNVMLAAIGPNEAWQGFHGTDAGGHCSIWSSWPRN